MTTGAKSRGSHALFRGWIKFNPYLETGVTLSTNRAEFSGNMEARVDSEFGRVTVMYPEPKPRTPNLSERRDNKNSKGQDRKNKINVIADAKDARITTGFSARVGLKVDFTPDSRVYSGAFPDVST